MNNLEQKIKQALDYFKNQMLSIRGGRSNAKLVEDIAVDYFGQKMPIKQLGSISVVPPREIHISVWDKNAASAVLKAIDSSNLNVGTNLDGNIVRVSLPPLSGERRIELTKLVKKETEDAKIKIRGLRDEENKEISGRFDAKEIGEDEKFKLKEKVQGIIDKANEEIESILESKIREIEE
ncbi:MAG: ribosome recycling factor [Candidatus Paceibacterota bacterium]